MAILMNLLKQVLNTKNEKIITSLFLFLFTVFVILIISLSTFGIQTDKFNNLISNKASQSKNIDLVLETIKFKIDPKKFSLFLETESPIITYRIYHYLFKALKHT